MLFVYNNYSFKTRVTMRVFTKISGKLAEFKVDTNDIELAIKTVKGSLSVKHRGAVLALVK